MNDFKLVYIPGSMLDEIEKIRMVRQDERVSLTVRYLLREALKLHLYPQPQIEEENV